MTRVLKTTLWIVVIAVTAAGAIAQSPFPFSVGERLTYEGKINKFAVSVTIGDMTFEVAQLSGEMARLKVGARSRGTMLKLFRYSFYQTMDTIADPISLFALSSTKHDIQKDKIRDSATTFDYSRKMVTWVETNPDEPAQP